MKLIESNYRNKPVFLTKPSYNQEAYNKAFICLNEAIIVLLLNKRKLYFQ